MNNYQLVKCTGDCLAKIVADVQTEFRDGTTCLDISMMKPELHIDIESMTPQETLETVVAYCYDLAGKYREAGNKAKQKLEEMNKPFSERVPTDVYYVI